jgi:hypothetical protein
VRLLHLTLVVALVSVFAAPAAAQQGRVQGLVRDVNGEPIRGAVIRATHPEAIPGELTATTDERGRFAIIGMRTGAATIWRFVAEAPGYFPASVEAALRSNVVIPLSFTLGRDLGPMPGALSGDIQSQLTAANALRDEGRLDQAIAAYQAIQARNTRLTSIGIVLGDTYRRRAPQESSAAGRQQFLQRAIASYQAVLKSDATNSRARTELDAAAADLKRLTP